MLYERSTWRHVSTHHQTLAESCLNTLAKLSSPNDDDGSGPGEQGLSNPKSEINLPRTLVRIPFETEMQHDTAREEG